MAKSTWYQPFLRNAIFLFLLTLWSHPVSSRSDLSFFPAGLSLWVKGSPGRTDLLKITLLQQNEEFTHNDDRIAGVVSVAGFSLMRAGGEENGREGIKALSYLHGLMPRLLFFAGHTNRLPFDFVEVMACIAPRPLLVIAPLYDKDACLGDIRQAVGETRKVYGIFNAANRINLFVPDDYNRFSPVMRAELYRWLKTESNGNKNCQAAAMNLKRFGLIGVILIRWIHLISARNTTGTVQESPFERVYTNRIMYRI